MLWTADIHTLSGSNIKLNTVRFIQFLGKIILEACLKQYRTLFLECGESQI